MILTIHIPKRNKVTNGDMIKAIFPNAKINFNGFIVECELEEFGFNVEESWWNAPYELKEKTNDRRGT